MRKFVSAFLWSVFATVTGLIAYTVWKDLGIRREIWHDVTSDTEADN